MNLIAIVDQNWAIGNEGRQLVTIPDDQRWFHMETRGKVLIVGRKTLETMPGGIGLPDRRTICLTRNPSYTARNVEMCHSVEEVLQRVKEIPDEDIYVAGGGEIYRAFLPYCKVAHITRVDYVYEADVFCPDLDKLPEWQITRTSEEKTYFNLVYEFVKYERTK